MSPHDRILDRLPLLLDNDLPPVEMQEIIEHLSRCDACRTELDAMRGLAARLVTLRRPVPGRSSSEFAGRTGGRERRTARIGRAAAAAFLLLAGATAGYLATARPASRPAPVPAPPASGRDLRIAAASLAAATVNDVERLISSPEDDDRALATRLADLLGALGHDEIAREIARIRDGRDEIRQGAASAGADLLADAARHLVDREAGARLLLEAATAVADADPDRALDWLDLIAADFDPSRPLLRQARFARARIALARGREPEADETLSRLAADLAPGDPLADPVARRLIEVRDRPGCDPEVRLAAYDMAERLGALRPGDALRRRILADRSPHAAAAHRIFDDALPGWPDLDALALAARLAPGTETGRIALGLLAGAGDAAPAPEDIERLARTHDDRDIRDLAAFEAAERLLFERKEIAAARLRLRTLAFDATNISVALAARDRLAALGDPWTDALLTTER